MPNRRPPTARRLFVSLLVTAVVVVPILWIAAPIAYRWSKLRHLTSGDPNERQPALVYVAKKASSDPAVLRDAITRLDDDRDDVFRAIMFAIDAARQWRRPTIPDDAWLRWVNMLATEFEPSGRTFAAQQLGMLRDLADDRRVLDMTATLLADADDGVRVNALIAAAELTQASTPSRQQWVALLGGATRDANAEIARQAWLLAGLLDVAQVTEQELRGMPLIVAQAAAWADSRRNPGEASLAWKIVQDEAAPMDLRAAVAGALIGKAGESLPLPELRTPTSPAEQVLMWRLLLAGDDALSDADRIALQPYMAAIEEVECDDVFDALLPLMCVATYRLGEVPGTPRSASQVALNLLALASVESPQRPMNVNSDEYFGDSLLVYLMATRRDPSLVPQSLLAAMRDESATTRDMACLVAMERLDAEALATLVGDSLNSYDNDAKMAGALLAGLSDTRPTGIAGPIRDVRDALKSQGQDVDFTTWTDQQLLDVGLKRTDLLEQRERAEDAWEVKQVMRLGLWLQGRLPEMDGNVEPLLASNYIPRTHVLFAMLHKGDRTAFEVLFAPRGETGVDLLQLLGTRRWCYILQRYLPADAPTLTVWADDDWQRLQIDLLRNWWLLYGDGAQPEAALSLDRP